MPSHFAPGERTSYSDTNYLLLGRIVEGVTGQPLREMYDSLIFIPLHLTHTYLLPSEDRAAPRPADVFAGPRDIGEVRSNGIYRADGRIVSTPREMILFLRSLKTGRLLRADSLQAMHDWHPWRFPLQYGLGTMHFDLPEPLASVIGLPPLWGHSGSTGSFLYYAADLDLYLAGTLDQTESRVRPFLLMRRVLQAIRRRTSHRLLREVRSSFF
jgi:D-alanyl-D-alanine carboxypeptidase